MQRRISLAVTALAAVLCLALAGCGSNYIDLTGRTTAAMYWQGDTQAVINQHGNPTSSDNSFGLHESMAGSAYLANGDTANAYRSIRTAYDIMNSFMTDQGGEPHFYKAESDKTFLGDPVEMSLNSWYMALLNFQRHDYSNCVAACKNAILADQPLKWEDQSQEDAEKHLVPKDHYVDDNGMLYLLEARGMMRAGGWSKDDIASVVVHGKEAFLRCSSLFAPSTAKAEVDALFDAMLDGRNNVIFIIDLGLCPKHVGVGEYKEKVHINPVEYADTNARLIIDGKPVATVRVCDVAYQAVHRGERNFDETLNGRAQFKDSATEGGKAAVVVGAVMMSSDNATVRGAGLAVAGIGALFWAMGASTHPEADLRQWELLPGQVNMVILPMKPGQYTVTCEGLDINLSPLNVPRTCTRSFEVPERGDVLVYMRPLPACANPSPPPPVPANTVGDDKTNEKQIQQSNDMGKDAFAKEKAHKDAEDKARQENEAKPQTAPAPNTPAPAPAPAPSSSAPAPEAAPTASAPVESAPAAAVTPAVAPATAPAVDAHPGTWSTTTSGTTTTTPTTTPSAGETTPASTGATGTWTEK